MSTVIISKLEIFAIRSKLKCSHDTFSIELLQEYEEILIFTKKQLLKIALIPKEVLSIFLRNLPLVI